MSNCNPECGILTKTNHNKDSTDKAGNLFTNPIFAGSPADSAARYADIENAQDTTAASGESDESFHQTPWRYRLSDYSPCVDAGSPAKRFRDDNETRNDIGVFGGPEFFREE